MSDADRLALVAFDGSAPAREAVRTAATLLAGTRLLVVSVWEPGLALPLTPVNELSAGYMPPSPQDVIALDRIQHDRATDIAVAGARLAEGLGARAEPLAVCDEVDVADTLIAVADRHDVCAIVVGSRGLGTVKSLFGSTSRTLLHKTERPVLVVRTPHEED